MCLHVSIKQGRRAIIPCRVIDRKTTVKLVKTPEYERVKVPESEIPVHEGLTYKPNIGFRIRYPTNVFNGMFRCDATLGNTTDSIKVALMFKGRYLSLSRTGILYIFIVLFLIIYGIYFIMRRAPMRDCVVQITARRARADGFSGR